MSDWLTLQPWLHAYGNMAEVNIYTLDFAPSFSTYHYNNAGIGIVENFWSIADNSFLQMNN